MDNEGTMELASFLESPGVIFDVRSPSEHRQGRIPGSYGLPLFSDDERAEVGTCYKQVGHNAAVELGLKLAGPKFADLVAEARKATGDSALAKVHCWRGGMRSEAVVWLLKMAGMEAVTLKGGYKVFRRWCLDVVEHPHDIRIVGGLTGSGKTNILHALARQGEQVLDLEGLACHRGSAFGKVPGVEQPSTEQFENEISIRWSGFDKQRPVWIEDESFLVGACKVPDALRQQTHAAPRYFIERPDAERLSILERDYSNLSEEYLITSTERIKKKLGSQRTQHLITTLQCDGFVPFAAALLEYYDKTYRYSLSRHPGPIYKVSGEGLSDDQWAERLCAEASDQQPLGSVQK